VKLIIPAVMLIQMQPAKIFRLIAVEMLLLIQKDEEVHRMIGLQNTVQMMDRTKQFGDIMPQKPAGQEARLTTNLPLVVIGIGLGNDADQHPGNGVAVCKVGTVQNHA